MVEGIKVSWFEDKFVTPPEQYNSFPTEEDYKAYYDVLKKSHIEHTGTIISFVNTFFCGQKAIIKGDDKKIYSVFIDKLTVLD